MKKKKTILLSSLGFSGLSLLKTYRALILRSRGWGYELYSLCFLIYDVIDFLVTFKHSSC